MIIYVTSQGARIEREGRRLIVHGKAEMTPDGLQSMKQRMKTVIEPAEDGVKIFRLCQSCTAKRTGLGLGRPALPDAAWHIF